MGIRLEIHPKNPQPRFIQQAVKCLEDGGVIIYPTDTVYALGCDIQNKKALERVCQIKGIDPDKSQFSCICPDLKTVSEYAIHIGDGVFKMMRQGLPWDLIPLSSKPLRTSRSIFNPAAKPWG
jgi:tRNA threonylcarbamoyl adenosine modification protein (Sua5/YciO/YrdC/YwlC family)